MAEYFVAIHKDEQVYKRSSSGGAFTAITDKLYEAYSDLIVYGCAFDNNLNAMHIRAVDKSDRDRMCGSKYISSDLGNSYTQVYEDLKNGSHVVFSGTPCQVAGLKSFLGAKNCDTNNLTTVDFICHGVGSNKFFDDYIRHLESKYKSKAVSCNFRGKSKPGKFQEMIIGFANGKKYISTATSLDWFYSLYHRNLILRPSCYKCRFSKDKMSDITIGDDWSKNRDILKAHSLIVTNTSKGSEIINDIDSMQITKIENDEINQPNAISSTQKPSNYDKFWQIYTNKGYLAAQKYVGNNTMKGKTKALIGKTVEVLNLRNIAKKLKGALHGK